MLTVQRGDQRESSLFQIDNTTVVSYLWREDGTECRELNGLSRGILLSCLKEGAMICPEYLQGIVNLRANTCPEGREPRNVV